MTVQAIRFSDDVPAMQRFLETLGLAASVTSDEWAVMESGSGQVLLHGTANATSGAQSGWTQLTFETDDLDSVAAEFGVTPVDEAWGRSLFVTHPLGAEVTINETQTDHYGYQQHEAHPDPAVAVVPVRFTDPQGPYAPFLALSDFAPRVRVTTWRSSPTAGRWGCTSIAPTTPRGTPRRAPVPRCT